MDTHAHALEARQAALRAQMVAGYGDGVRIELPPVPGDPHVLTSLPAFIERVAEIEALARRNTSRAPILRRFFARTFRRPRQHRRVRPSGTRGSPTSGSSSSDDPDPPGFRISRGVWLLLECAAFGAGFYFLAAAAGVS